jgi:hypothetical protein
MATTEELGRLRAAASCAVGFRERAWRAAETDVAVWAAEGDRGER